MGPKLTSKSSRLQQERKGPAECAGVLVEILKFEDRLEQTEKDELDN